MAIRVPPTSTHGQVVLNPLPPPRFDTNRIFLLSTFNLRRPYPLLSSNSGELSGRCFAASSGPTPPPESEPPTDKDKTLSAGPEATFARLKDTLQIFFAVLFWMSLFFWSSAWGNRNNGGPDKGSRFRR